jgi:pimeloyl-ACP methyl ester carboxylesterase
MNSARGASASDKAGPAGESNLRTGRSAAQQVPAACREALSARSPAPTAVSHDRRCHGRSTQTSDGHDMATNRTRFYRDFAAGPFYGYNRPGAEASEAIIENWWRQGMMGGAKADYDGIVAFSQTDFTADLKKISVPVLIMLGRALRRLRAADRQTRQERHAEDLPRLPARHAHHSRRRHQRRPAGLAACLTA